MNYLTDINIQFVLETSTVNKISTLAFKILNIDFARGSQ